MNSEKKTTEIITIWGIVQGVGFRPFVTKLAHKLGVNGRIKNMGGFVQLYVSGTKSETDAFIQTIREEKPSASDIVRIQREQTEYEEIKGFTIGESEIKDDEIGMIPADIAICDSCMEEFYDPRSPRYKHPYISCTVCGPRYTIIQSLPYDRINTTMSEFPMCDFCRDEYNNPETKRYHSQTISCHDCGPMPEYITQNGEHITVKPYDANREAAAKAAVKDIKEGKVTALKGTGGYYLVASPFMDDAVKTLREVKLREEKPFAILFKDTESIRNYCHMNNEEEELLKSSKRPIVLLERKEKSTGPIIMNDVCRSSRYIGAFLPSMGLQYQLIEDTGPLIMTSANLSDLPIIYKDEDMAELLKNEKNLSGILFNKRKIDVSLDDSVTRVIDGQPQITRRSKGYAPVPIYIEKPEGLDKKHQIFATGGHLKSAFSLSKGNFAYVSQYFGDLDSVESQKVYESNFHRMKDFFGINPSLIVSDMHPLYFTSGFAEECAGDCRHIKVQHHHAHTASVMAEHGLTGPVIGVSFDGTGYGTDGSIWGGEFLICHNDEFGRHSHLKYVDILGGDSSMKEGWKSAISHRLAYLSESSKSTEKPQTVLDISHIIDYSIKGKTLARFNEIPIVESAIKNGINTVRTSSMGRLFDAVASLLGIHHINRYEGECAIMLENAAYQAMKSPGTNKAWDLALKFHEDVAELILRKCHEIREETGINDAALSGGVFQNKILMEKSLALLRENEFNVYYNIAVPTNDGGIALGQNYIGMQYLINNKDI